MSAWPVAVYVRVTVGSVTHSSAMTRMVIPHDGPTILSPWHPVDKPRMVVNVGGVSSAVVKHKTVELSFGSAPAGAVYRQ